MVHGRLPVRPPLFDVSGTLWHDGHPMPEALFALCEGRQRVEPCLRMGFMSSTLGVPILRLFKARAKPNCESALAEKLAMSSVQVVHHEPGFLGFVCAGPANSSDRDFVFASMWRDVDAIKARFGRDWRVSFLPPGYVELIEECSVEHYHLTEQSFPR